MRLATIAAALLCLASPALAVDFTKPLLDLKGVPMHETDEKSPIVTLGIVASAALIRAPGTEGGREVRQADPIRLAKRALLAQRIALATDDIALTAEETAEIKQAVAVFPPLFVLRMIEAIDPASIK